MNRKKTAVEVYLSTVFKWGLIILVSACMCATVMFNTEKMFGLYPAVSWLATIGLGIMDVTFFIMAVFIIKTSFDKDGYLKEGKLKVGNFSYPMELSVIYASVKNFLGIFILFPYFNSILFRY